jgi:hypothetical protein
MPCERYRDALTEVAAGEPVSPALDAHLAGCAGCRSGLAQMRQLMAAADESLSTLAEAEPSASLRVRIREAAMRADPGSTLPWRWRWAWPATAAAVLALAAAGAWRATVAHVPVAPAVAEGARPSAAAPAGRESGIAPAPTGTDVARRPPAGPVRASAASPRVTRVAMREPEVLVPSGQQEALLQFVALVHRERLQAPSLATAGQPSADLREPAPIDIRPLEIVPLDPAESPGT